MDYKDGNKNLLKRYLVYHWQFFRTVSDEHGEQFDQDISAMEKPHQGFWNDSMLADYCWTLYQDQPAHEHRRKSSVTELQCF